MIKGILFDLNGTLIDIRTDEGCPDIYRTMKFFLKFQGIEISEDELRNFYFETNRQQRIATDEEFPEFDVLALFQKLLEKHGSALKRLPPAKAEMLPRILSEIFRAASMFQLKLYDGVIPVLTELQKQYKLGALSDGQSIWAYPELRSLGLEPFFSKILVSSDLSFRKPDPRMFKIILRQMRLKPEEVIFVGNDMYHDILGAHNMKMKNVFFRSNQGCTDYYGAEPDYIIYNIRQLPEAIQFILKHSR